MKIISGLTLISIVLLIGSCSEPVTLVDPLVQWEKDVATIDAHLEDLNLEAEKHVSGVRTVIQQLGTGLPAYPSNTISVAYRGTLLNGTEFDSSHFSRPLSGLIRGWQFALTTLPAGSKATVYIPSYYGYGQVGTAGIPANSILVFEIDFKAVRLDAIQQEEFELSKTRITDYIAEQQIENVQTDNTGFKYVITQQGSGVSPTWYDKVRTRYSVRNLDTPETIVQTIETAPASNFNGRVIDHIHALKIILQHLQPGGKATLYVPAALGFGASRLTDSDGRQILPANSDIIVEVELLEVIGE